MRQGKKQDYKHLYKHLEHTDITSQQLEYVRKTHLVALFQNNDLLKWFLTQTEPFNTNPMMYVCFI